MCTARTTAKIRWCGVPMVHTVEGVTMTYPIHTHTTHKHIFCPITFGMSFLVDHRATVRIGTHCCFLGQSTTPQSPHNTDRQPVAARWLSGAWARHSSVVLHYRLQTMPTNSQCPWTCLCDKIWSGIKTHVVDLGGNQEPHGPWWLHR